MKENVQPMVPPVVAVLGHVDHGKTSLLDSIRKTSIAQKEHGGITQKIGASSVEIETGGKRQRITFIDTPGHEAFSAMRGRGAQAADIGLLIVSSSDGVMPQTKESIELLKQADIPVLVVLTKSDLETKNVEKIKQQILKEGILLEGLGGEVPVIEVSARTNSNIKELLELILLVWEMKQDSKGSPGAELVGIVIESRLDPRAGSRTTVVIKNGTIVVGDELFCEGVLGRARTLITDQGEHIKQATVGDAVEILGFEKTPPVGGKVVHKKNAKQEIQQAPAQKMQQVVEGANFMSEEKKPLSVLLCADTLGSLEAILTSLPEQIHIISQKTGEISEADVLLAKSTGSLIIGFNAKMRGDVIRLAKTEKILLKNYAIIYELIEELQDVLEGKQLSLQERILGKAKVLASFPFEKTKVLGIQVLEGRVAKGDKVRIQRGEDIIGESTITSVRQGKNQISKVEQGLECGIIISPFLDFTIGDMVLSHG